MPFYKYINCSIEQVFKKYKPKNTKNSFPTNEWFDKECKELKNKVNQSYQMNGILQHQSTLSKEYKRVTQLKKRQYQAKEAEKLSNLCSFKQQEFWKRWKN